MNAPVATESAPAKATERDTSGSIAELWRIAWPIMLMEISGLLMLFVDRAFVGHTSTTALNAVAVAGTIAWVAIDASAILTETGSIPIAHLDGASRAREGGRVAWQMIWIAVASPLVFLPLSAAATPLFGDVVGGADMTAYFEWLMWLAPFHALRGALAGVLIGRGRTRVLVLSGVLGNAVNLGLDALLIPGAGAIPPLGVAGAAIATGCGAAAQVLLLAATLIRVHGREDLGLGDARLHLPTLRACLGLGGPAAALVFVEMLGYGIFHLLYVGAPAPDVTFTTSAQSLLIPFLFVYIGIAGATSSVVAAQDGAGVARSAATTLRSAVRIAVIGGVGVAGFLVLAGPSLLGLLDVTPASLGAGELAPLLFVLVGLKVTSAAISGAFHGAIAGSGRTGTLLGVGAIATGLFLVVPAIAITRLQLPGWCAVVTWIVRDVAFCALAARALARKTPKTAATAA